MAAIQPRMSRGKKYWSIVESRRVNGKPRTTILEYLGTADSLLDRLQGNSEGTIKSYSHGDTSALLNVAEELDIIRIINRHIPRSKSGQKPVRDGLTVGASFLLAAIGRACHPTSKLGWYDWCKETSLQYSLQTSLKNLDSQHFWDQMDLLPVDAIPKIEAEITEKLLSRYNIKLGKLFFDTTNFFTFIDSQNTRCDLPQRGRNKQKRLDLRQIGMALLVSEEDQFPLFHRVYKGNTADVTVFKEVISDMTKRILSLTNELADITLVFDKGNNSKNNFELLDNENDLHYVGGLVSSYFVDLIKEANKNFNPIKIQDELLPAYRTTKEIWGKQRTCVVTISKQLRDGQIQGIKQHLQKKYKILEKLKQQLENSKRRKTLKEGELVERLKKIICGQFINLILKFDVFKLADGTVTFTYFIDQEAYDHLIDHILGRKILVTNRHGWTSEEIILTYRGQSKVEYAFRKVKNPRHLAIRPQYHWTDQKIEAHFLMCILGYLLTTVAYHKAQKQSDYKRNVGNFLEDLRSIRISCTKKNKSNKVKYQLESIDPAFHKTALALGISNETLRSKINFSDYN